jgi:lipopolysaccharide export system permease protein
VILNRYIQRSIYLGTLGALLLLVSLSLFFVFVRELDDLGRGSYGLPQAIQFVLYSLPGNAVEFLPLAVLLGSILSLGALAANSEVIAMQASGMPIGRLLAAVLQAAAILAVIGFLLGDWIVPDSESRARDIRNLTEKENTVLESEQGLWIKDEARVVRIGALLPEGFARDIEIFELDRDGSILSTLRAEQAVPVDGGWELRQVEKSLLERPVARAQSFDRLLYEGSLSLELLQVLKIKPRKMSIADLLAYLDFLDENHLDASAERLIFWKKLSSPITVFIMCLLAVPFVLGSQRQTGSGQRLLIGILLGLAYVVTERLLTQLGAQLGIYPPVVALLPNLMFLALAVYLLMRKLSYRIGAGPRGLRSS